MIKPTTLIEYYSWAKQYLSVNFTEDQVKNLYEGNLQLAWNSINEHPFVQGFDAKLNEWSEEYKEKTGSLLLMENSGMTLHIKSYESSVNKSFRTNVLRNNNFPNEPNEGWITDENIFSFFNDGIRSNLVCKFIDGPKFITEKIVDYAKEFGIYEKHYSQGQDIGYYAYHFYSKFPVKFVDKNWKSYSSLITVEIQATTQLQEVLNELTHSYYDEIRLNPEHASSEWKWDYTSNQFQASYISHTLHMIEGLVVQLRDQEKEKRRNKNA